MLSNEHHWTQYLRRKRAERPGVVTRDVAMTWRGDAARLLSRILPPWISSRGASKRWDLGDRAFTDTITRSRDDHAMIRDQTSLSSLWRMPFHSTLKLNWSLSALSVPYVCLVLLSGLRLWCPYGTQHGWHECLYAKSLESAANDVKTILDMSKLLEDAWSQLEVPFLRV
jgi:hypothetical protein